MKIALVHDDLIQWGGAEKVLAEISNIFPEAPIYTAISDLKNPHLARNFKGKKIFTSFLQKLPMHVRLYKALLPLYPIAFEQFDFSQYDVVLSHTTRFAKSIITKPETKHICYIHTPPRFLWNFSGEKSNWLTEFFFSKLRLFDFISSKRVDYWLAGSKNCQDRLMAAYGVTSKILYPFVDTEKFSPEKSFVGDYYLMVGRLNKYKQAGLVVKSFLKNGRKLKIAGSGPELNRLKELAGVNIDVLGSVSDELLESLLAGCRGLIIAGEEDFGMTAIEAQAFGKGVICYNRGGVLETVIDGKTGIYFDKQSVDSINRAVEKFENTGIELEECRKNALKFSKDIFRQKLKEFVTVQ